MAQPDSNTVIDRVFAILKTCAESRRTVSLADLARLTDLPKSTLHRICWKLESLGALEHHDDGFRIGPKLFALGAINPLVQRLRAQSMPYLYGMSAETGLIANLAVLDGNKALLIDEVFADERPLPRMVGAMLPLHATAVGKALLAVEPVERRRMLIEREPLHPYTSRTIVQPEVLLKQLENVAETGVAYSREEWRRGFAGVAAPIMAEGKAVGTLALVGIPRAADVTHYASSVLRAVEGTARALNRPVIRDSRSAVGELAV